MFDYAVSFYNNYIIIFYILLVIGVILEGPLVILALSFIAPKLGIGFWEILLFAFLGDFLGDLVLYFSGRFLSKYIFKKKIKKIQNLEDKLKKYSLLDKLIIIKYTPPITAIGFFYLGYIKTNFLYFFKHIFFLSGLSAILISIVGYNFGYLFKDNDNFILFISLVFIAFVLVYFIIKFVSSYFLKKIYDS